MKNPMAYCRSTPKVGVKTNDEQPHQSELCRPEESVTSTVGRVENENVRRSGYANVGVEDAFSNKKSSLR